MRRIRATAEIKALKTVIYERTMEVIILRNENDELRKQLEESRAKEGKGALETAMEFLADFVNGICDAIFEKPHDEIESLIIQNNNDEDGDSDAI